MAMTGKIIEVELVSGRMFRVFAEDMSQVNRAIQAMYKTQGKEKVKMWKDITSGISTIEDFEKQMGTLVLEEQRELEDLQARIKAGPVSVEVTENPDTFPFIGHCIGVKSDGDEILLSVRDQEDDVWDLEPQYVTIAK